MLSLYVISLMLLAQPLNGNQCISNIITSPGIIDDGECIESINTNYRLNVKDGTIKFENTITKNLIFSNTESNGASSHLSLQTDCNLVLYNDITGKAIWSANTILIENKCQLSITNDGILVLKNVENFEILWHISEIKMNDIFVNIMDKQYEFGVYGDNINDDTTSFQNAIDYVYYRGSGSIRIPSGKYLFEKGPSLIIYPGISLIGSYINTPSHPNIDNKQTININDGTVFIVKYGNNNPYDDDQSFIKMKSDSSLSGVVIYYINQICSHSVPIPYPPTIYMHGDNILITDIELINPWHAIKAVNAPRHSIKRIQGSPIKIGLFVDEIYDIATIEHIYWNNWFCSRNKYLKIQTTEGIGYIFHKSYSQYVLNTFVTGYYIGYLFEDSITKKNRKSIGGTNGNFDSIGADESIKASIVIRSSADIGLIFTNSHFKGSDIKKKKKRTPIHVIVRSTNDGPVSFEQSSFSGSSTNIAYLEGSNVITFDSCLFIEWDAEHIGDAAIYSNNGYLLLNSNTFSSINARHLYIDNGVNTLTLSNNIVVNTDWNINIDINVRLQCQNQFIGYIEVDDNDKAMYCFGSNSKNNNYLTSLISNNCKYELIMECSGNLVLYNRITQKQIYSTHGSDVKTAHNNLAYLLLQINGNLGIFEDDTGNTQLWNGHIGNTNDTKPYRLYVTDNGNIEWADGNEDILFSSDDEVFEQEVFQKETSDSYSVDQSNIDENIHRENEHQQQINEHNVNKEKVNETHTDNDVNNANGDDNTNEDDNSNDSDKFKEIYEEEYHENETKNIFVYIIGGVIIILVLVLLWMKYKDKRRYSGFNQVDKYLNTSDDLSEADINPFGIVHLPKSLDDCS